MKSEQEYKAWVIRLHVPMLPTFERFYLMLPDLGQEISGGIVRAYAEIMRIGELIDREITKPGMSDRDYVGLSAEINKHLGDHAARIGKALEALKPYAKD